MNTRFALNLFGILTIIACVCISLLYGEIGSVWSLFYIPELICLLLLLVFSIHDYGKEVGDRDKEGEPSSLVLLSEEDTVIKSWHLIGKDSLVIGKKNAEEDVDVDLSDTAFAGTVSDVHAVLNYMNQSWYIEDLDSKNGTQLRESTENKLYQIKNGQSIVRKRDDIYIGLNKLQLR